MHAALLTYASDRGYIATAHAGLMKRRPRPSSGMAAAASVGASASLDHSIWFHRPPRFDDWLLFTSESPVAHAARALILGQMYDRDGVQVASVAQEALIRQPRG
jgi:acyl-CoA thioesterase-2